MNCSIPIIITNKAVDSSSIRPNFATSILIIDTETMDLRNHKRKRLALSEDAFEKYFSPMKDQIQDQMCTDEVSLYSFGQNRHKALCNGREEPESFLESGEASENITISDDTINPMIMPQEVVVYGYENASINSTASKGESYTSLSFNYTIPSQPSNNIVRNRKHRNQLANKSTNKQKDYVQQARDPSTSRNSIQNKANISKIKTHVFHHQNSMNTDILKTSRITRDKADQTGKYYSSKVSSDYISNIPINKISQNVGYKDGLKSSVDSAYPNRKFSSSISKQYSLCICTHCNTEFRSPSEYLTHLRSLINTKTLCCLFCNDHLEDESQIVSHVSHHSNVTSYFCTFCTMVFYRPNSLTFHLIYREGSTIQKCRHCPMKFCTKTGLKDHMHLHLNKLYECSICCMKFFEREIFRQHKLSYHNPNTYFSQKMLTLSRNSKPTRVLPCKNKLSIPQTLKGKSTLPICENCTAVFKKNKYLKQHIKRKVCFQQETKCEKENLVASSPSIASESNMVNHSPKDNTASKFEMDEFTCKFCSASFKKLQYLLAHIQNRICLKKQTNFQIQTPENFANNSNIGISCQFCSKSFKKKLYLTGHIQNRVCLRKQSSLRNEVTTSPSKTNGIDTTCLQSPKQDTKKTFQYDHNQNGSCVTNQTSNDNVKAKICVCQTCSRTFKKRSYLLKHIRKHVCQTNISLRFDNIARKPMSKKNTLSCQNCTFKFKKRSYLFKHMRNKVCDREESSFTSNKERMIDSNKHDVPIAKDKRPPKPKFSNLRNSKQTKKFKDILKDHPNPTEKPFPYLCDNCGAHFKFLSRLQRHINTKICLEDKSRPNLSLLKYKDLIKTSFQYVCTHCSAPLCSRRSLLRHLSSGICMKRRSSHGMNYSPVKRISAEFSSSSTNQESAKNDFSWACELCKKVFYTKFKATRHLTRTSCSSIVGMRTLSAIFEQKYTTSKSKKKTPLKSVNSQRQDSILNQSKKNKNSNAMELMVPSRKSVTFKCVDCSKTFTDIQIFHGHISTSICLLIPGTNMIKPGKKICSGCGKQYHTQYQVRMHSRNKCMLFKRNA